MEAIEEFEAYGHPNILAIHESTLEITKENWLTKRGDCIIAVRSSKSIRDLSPKLKAICKNDNAKITLVIQADQFKEEIIGKGSSRLILTNPVSMVIRKSDFICDRTLMIHSNKAACNLSRELISKLRNSNQKVKVTIKAELKS